MDDNITTILQMVQAGKITPQEAQGLINAVNRVQSGPEPTAASPAAERSPQGDGAGFSPVGKGDHAKVSAAPAHLAPTDLLIQIADDPSIPEDEKLNIIIHATALLTTVLAMQPIPGIDVFFFTPVQVASAVAMSRVMGDPLGKNGAGEIVTSVLGVVGLGLVAEQIFVMGAKIVLPIFGGLALVPLLYATSYGLGYTIRAALEARRNNQTLSDDELRRVKAEAEQRARAQKRDWSLNALKRELQEWRDKAEAYKRFETDYEAAQREAAALQSHVNDLSAAFASLQQRKLEVEGRWHEMAAKIQDPNVSEDEKNAVRAEFDPLSKEVDDLNAHWSAKGEELDRKQKEADRLHSALKSLLETRFASAYPRVRLATDVLTTLAQLSFSELREAERQIALLQNSAARADFQGGSFHDGAGRTVRTVSFGSDGRMYVANSGDETTVLRVGSGLTATRDVAWLQANAA